MLRPEFVTRKLQLITDDLGHLDTFRHVAHDALVADPLALATVERLIERIVMRAVDVNQHLVVALATGTEVQTTRLTYRDSFVRLAGLEVLDEGFAADIARTAGLRNVLVQDYTDADRSLVHAAIALFLDQYPQYVESVTSFVDSLDSALESE